MIRELDEISADKKAKRTVALVIHQLADLCISAGAYDPWLEKLKAIKEAAITDTGVKEAKRDQAERATAGLVKKTDTRREIARRIAAAAPRKLNGKVLNPKRLLDAVNKELEANELDLIESTKTLQQYLVAIASGQT